MILGSKSDKLKNIEVRKEVRYSHKKECIVKGARLKQNSARGAWVHTFFVRIYYFFPNLNILKFSWSLQCQRCNLVWKLKEYIQIFADVYLNHKANQKMNRVIDIVMIVQKINVLTAL